MSVTMIQSGRFSTAFSPLDLSPVLWIDPSDSATVTLNGSTVSQINDKSGNGRHLSQGTSTAQPTLSSAAQNGLDIMTFDGGDSLNYDGGSNVFSCSGETMFVIAKKTSVASNTRIIGCQTSGGGNDFSNPSVTHYFASTVQMRMFSTNSADGPSITACVCHQGTFRNLSGTSVVRTNGVAGTSVTQTSPGGIRYIWLGSQTGTGGYHTGTIGEVIWYDYGLSDDQVLQVEAYLKAKWGTP